MLGPAHDLDAVSPSGAPFVAPEPADLAAHFPQLEILSLLGQGGMGAVYMARQRKLDRLVALKVLPAEWGRDPAFAERFQREARALARLNHPNIVAVHDFGEAGRHFFLLMEYVDGANLRRVLQGGPPEPRLALQIIPQICDALQYAHEEGVVHRDVKPENILLDARGRVKIADFGLAKLVGPSRASFTLTGTHQVMGTLDYMAPEQRSRPQDVDHRADIYSLGVVFYEMLTGELPLGRFAPPSQKSGVDGRIDEVVFRALEREPDKRYQRASEVRVAVEAISGGASAPAAAPESGWGSPLAPVPADVQLQTHGPAAALFISALVAVLQWGFVAFMTVAYNHNSEFEGGLALGNLCGLIVAISLALPIVIASIKLRQLDSQGLVVAGVILAMLPWSIHFLIGVPAGVWALYTLSRPKVRAAFAANLRRRQQNAAFPALAGLPPAFVTQDLQLQVRGPATALFLTGLVGAVECVVAACAFTMSYGDPNQIPEAAALFWTCIAVVVSALVAAIILGSIHLRRFQGYEFVVIAAVLAMLPWSAHCLIGLPAGIWTIWTLSQPQVRAAFAAKLRLAAGVVGPLAPVAPPLPARPRGAFPGKARSFWRAFVSVFLSSPRRQDSLSRPQSADKAPAQD
jgi:predicted Ser/Thr protein kinase